MMRKLLTPRWILTTLLVIAAVGVMVRLGIWQLDRLQQRRVFNARVTEQINAPELDLNQYDDASQALVDMEYRDVVVTGRYLDDESTLQNNQVWEGQIGYSLLTPLLLDGTNEAILVNRGWIPLEKGDAALQGQYARSGEVTVRGKLRRSQVEPAAILAPDPTFAPGETSRAKWRFVNVERIGQQVSVPLLPVYVQEAPETGETTPPVASLPQVEISEGPHMGYALQWFAFAAILALGYPFFVRKQLLGGSRPVKRTAQPQHDPVQKISEETSRGGS